MACLAQYPVVVTVAFGWHLGEGCGSKMQVMLPPQQLPLFPTPLKRDRGVGAFSHGSVPVGTGGYES